ncbi:MAG: Na(+)/H(+) antiporter subunit B [Spirochaetales bacterium]
MAIDLAIIAIGVAMAIAGYGAVRTKSLLVSIILSGGVSLAASVVFLLMGAPDVAMTEAAIGSALTTVVFLYALARSKQSDLETSDKQVGNPMEDATIPPVDPSLGSTGTGGRP